MNVITINVGQGGCNAALLLIGYAGEDSVDAVDFDFFAWAQDYGEGTISLELMRAGDTAPYPALLTVDGTVARWTVSDVDTARSGPGVAQLVYKPTGATKKSAIYKFYVGRSLTEPGGDDPWGPIIERMEEILAEMQQQAAAADQSAEDAIGSAQDAEAWAVGERGGEPVPVTDETHENNAKYYAEQAGETAREFSEVTAPAAVRAVNEAGQTQTQAITDAGAAAVQAVSAERAGALDAIGTAGQTAVSDVDTAKTGAVQAVNTAKTDAVAAIGQKSTEEQAAVEQKGEDALAALQEYADLPGEVDNLKSTINTKAPVIINTASGAVASFDDGADGMPLKSLTVSIEPAQSGTGDPSPTNVRPISGWTGCNVTRTGKNLLNIHGNYIVRTGYTGTYTIQNESITVKANGNYVAYCGFILQIPVGYSVVLSYISEAKVSIKWLDEPIVAITAPYFGAPVASGWNAIAPKKYLLVSFSGYPSGSTYSNVKVEFGDTVTAYEVYQGTTIPISWQSEAGTVYGGTLIIDDDGTGELIVDRAMVDAGNYSFEKEAFENVITWKMNAPGAIYGTPLLSSKYTQDNGYLASMKNNTCWNKDWWSQRNSIFFRNTDFDDLSAQEVKEAMAGTQVCYYLSNPITYQLTAQQVIDTLYGTNNIWADCGPVSVDYPADTKLYIQKINAPTDDDMIADARIESGKYFLVGNTLYLSTTVIPAGDTIIPGTNCQKTNLAAALNALNT